MQINQVDIEDTREEIDIIESLFELDDKSLLDLGCGEALLSRELVSRGRERTLIATEVDAIQHAKNMSLVVQKNIRFENWGAENILAEDASFDVVFMFKSLHHVPAEMMPRAFAEIHRVLKHGGCLYISEPIFDGDFNDVLKIFHDEEKVRAHAFSEIKKAVANKLFSIEHELFFRSKRIYEDFSAFEKKIIRATHTQHDLNSATLKEAKACFDEKIKVNGGVFWSPMRIDLLVKS